MAKVQEVVCDVSRCQRKGAESFAFFSHRASDGAGSMEDWDRVFDLCPVHQALLLRAALAALTREHCSALVTRFSVSTREG